MPDIDFEKLSAPFDEGDLEWRVQSCGSKEGKPWARVMPYVTCRAIMDRLDQVCGPAKWKNRFDRGPDGGVLCEISILLSGEWIGKWDGAGNGSRVSDGGEKNNEGPDPVKTALSNAMKRASVQWGIGRYLYRIEPAFATVTESGRFFGKTKDGMAFRWNPPDFRYLGGQKRAPNQGKTGQIRGDFGDSEGEKGKSEGKREGKSGEKQLTIADAKVQMDKISDKQELLTWLTANQERLKGCKKAALAYFNERMRQFKAK
jgi:hypothetical protein